MAGEEFDDGFGMRGEIAEIFVQHQDEADAVLGIETEDAIHGIEGDGFGLRREGRRLTEGATEAAAARGKENADGDAPATGKAEFGNERRVLNFLERSAELPR